MQIKGVNLVPEAVLVWPAERYISVPVNTGVLFWVYRYFIYLIYICVCVCARARALRPQYFLNTFTTNHMWLFFIGSNLNLH